MPRGCGRISVVFFGFVAARLSADSRCALLDAGADPDVGIDLAIENGDEAVIRMLIEAGAAPTTAEGQTEVRPQ